MHNVNSKYIRIPVRPNETYDSFLDSSYFPTASSPPFVEMRIDQSLLKAECVMAVNRYRYNRHNHTTGIVIIGKDKLERISNLKADQIPDTFYQDLFNFKIEDHYIILDGASMGALVLPIPRALEHNNITRELTDRERMSSAHISAVAKLVADQGNAQRGEYADGWMACLRSMCSALGVIVPDTIPFKEMRTLEASDDIIRRLIEENYACSITSATAKDGDMPS